MTLPMPGAASSRGELILGVAGFAYRDLYDPLRLRDLTDLFFEEVKKSDPDLHTAYLAYVRSKGSGLTPVQQSDLILRMAPRVSRFIARLFRIEKDREADHEIVLRLDPIFEFRKHFIARRVMKRFSESSQPTLSFAEAERRVRLLQQVAFPETARDPDAEAGIARIVNPLVELDREFERFNKNLANRVEELRPLIEKIRRAMSLHGVAGLHWGEVLRRDRSLAPVRQDEEFLRRLLDVLEQWAYLRWSEPEGRLLIRDWISYKTPKKLDYFDLAELVRPRPDLPETIVGPYETRRKRDGFKLTDERYTEKQILYEVDYCVFCHDRDKDSCSKGIREKDGSTKINPLTIPLTGCPLDEKISEFHLLKKRGDSIAALATIMIDNPTVPGTGHRICNDCMKACIYQKQEPVNIPQIETRVLTDVLDLPWGFEIYCLLTRWNPLNVHRPYPLPYNGKNVLIVGMGPAGYTLAQFLLNEGFGCVGIDGLKLEPLSERLIWDGDAPPCPVKNFRGELYEELDRRILSGFGGVAEYGITVRWDKNFLALIYIALMRRETFRAFGGTRFGGTITIEDAWAMGFDHIAIATGAGRPTIVDMKNNLIRGIRKASDFLMALQLTGAFKASSLANLQVRLPATVIGGGLTAIDTATELMAYYPAQVEKFKRRWDTLASRYGEEALWSRYDAEEKIIAREFLEHAAAIAEERTRAKLSGDPPDFATLIRAWGGVSILYRKGLVDSPAYRLNHEEIIKSLEEGIVIVEHMNPVEAVPDEFGALKALIFERQARVEGKWRGTGERQTFPARSCFVAAGTTPNIIYEKEFPGTFELDDEKKFFRRYKLVWNDDPAPRLVPVEKGDDDPGVFTSYAKEGRFITFYGDNHPVFAGNVVKAMASARMGYRFIVRLFEREIDAYRPEDQPKREEAFAQLGRLLDENLNPTVDQVLRLTPTIVEVVVRAPLQARKFEPGQFFRLQNYEARAPVIEDTRLAMEGIALTGAWVDKEEGLLSLITLEMGSSSRLCATLKPGDPVVVMGPTGHPTAIPEGETVLLAGGGLGNAVLFSIGQELRKHGNRVLYFAAYRKPDDVYHVADIERASDVIIWSVDSGTPIVPKRPQDKSFAGNIVQAMIAYEEGKLGERPISLSEVDRIIAIGSDRMMAAVKRARHDVLAPYLKQGHIAIGSINSTMQCMMKEVCAQCLQKHVDPATGREVGAVFSCFNQDQHLDVVDWTNLNERLKMNSVQEKLTNLWLDYLLEKKNVVIV